MKFIAILVVMLSFAGAVFAEAQETPLQKATRITNEVENLDSELNQIFADGTQAQYIKNLTPLVEEMSKLALEIDCNGKKGKELSDADFKACSTLNGAFVTIAYKINSLKETRDNRRAQLAEEEFTEATE